MCAEFALSFCSRPKNAIIHYGESKVPLKSIVVFLCFTLLLVYFAFLNPNEIDIHLTQVHSLRLPMIVLFFGCVLLGILIASFLNWTLSIKTSFENVKEIRRRRHQEKINQRAGKFFEKAESLMAGGSVSKAIPIYKKILKLSPGHLGALNRLRVFCGRKETRNAPWSFMQELLR